ncbi:MAG: class I SAM-dependent methyltransferase [Cryobacterium sp.]|uniref:SAM-dependent methyltransferase n=1 Tax=unclassified Cryobacterium TaxID=2649013 RepID=UPI0018C91131|nr:MULTISPECIES: class I SAM-dependent methyltransferase [unclassified Cryobacterium]MCY7404416.1 class I SAM-dependent methyltransferase [Cryobacterium sp.]MEC5155776.1 tellurite methyltransferase [Cryobacterium sp. CAN_C3]
MVDLPVHPTQDLVTDSVFAGGRAETLRYHEDLYASTPLGTAGSWLLGPDRLVLKAIDLSGGVGPILAFDLGAGIGRHTIPMARGLAAGSRVVAVDVIPSAIRRLEVNCAEAGVSDSVTPIVRDLEEFEFDVSMAVGLIVGFSAVEHVSSATAMRGLLSRCAAATAPSGLIALGIFADRIEELADGTVRRALVEFELDSKEVRTMLDEVFSSWIVEYADIGANHVSEERDGIPYELRSTLIQFIGRRPG